MLPGLSTRSNTQHGRVSEPPTRALVQLAFPAVVLNNRSSPPGAAKSTSDCPKSVYSAGPSRLVLPDPKPVGPVAEIANTWGDCGGHPTRFAVWSKSMALFADAAHTAPP